MAHAEEGNKPSASVGASPGGPSIAAIPSVAEALEHIKGAPNVGGLHMTQLKGPPLIGVLCNPVSPAVAATT